MVLKICGITRLSDADAAVANGATALGFVFWPTSPRFVSPERAAAIVAALPKGIATFGVFVNEAMAAVEQMAMRVGLTTVQLHGDECAEDAARLRLPVVRAVTLEEADVVCDSWPADATFLLDAADREKRGGTGRTVDWSRARDFASRRRVILAGGLTPGNVAEAIESVRPGGVDVSSGVEIAPGIKDPGKVAAFLANARRAFEKRG